MQGHATPPQGPRPHLTVCARGYSKLAGTTLMQKGFVCPSLPCRPLKPWTGTRDVPVTNCSSLARCSWVMPSTTAQNQRTSCGESVRIRGPVKEERERP